MSSPIRSCLNLSSVQSALQSISELFLVSDLHFGHGSDNAWDEAVYLVLTLLDLPLDSDKSVLPNEISSSEAELISQAVTLRVDEKVPLPYILHQAWFMGMSFYVDKRVLIPRSPFAEIIQAEFRPWVTNQVNRICEIGAGSACMSIAAAKIFPHAQIDACDISPDALVVAKKNIQAHGVGDHVKPLQSDVYSNLSTRYDVIMSNPPYVGRVEMSTLPDEYRHEPVLALEADNDGMAIVDSILRGAERHLSEQGVLFVEVGNTMDLVESAYPSLSKIWLELEYGGHGIFMVTKQDLQSLGGNSER